MPPKAKKNTVHQQGGLAAPGKRIQKPKATISLPDQLPNGHRHPSSPASSSSDVTPGAHASLQDNNVKDGDLDRTMQSATSLNGSAHHHSPPNTPSSFPAYPGITKGAATPNANIFSIASTIIKTCPLQDVITILIVLLQLPPAFITAVNLLYALLTFIPSSANASLSSLPSLNDMFLGSGGTPSLIAIVGADLFLLILWSLLWAPAQNFALDLAQAVIAISLGGAAAGRGGTFGTTVWCLVVIIFMHMFRLKSSRQNVLTSAWVDLVRGHTWNTDDQPGTEPTMAVRQSPSGIRSGLAIHILAQGLVRIIRRWLFRREASQTIPSRKKNDPEAAPNIPFLRTNSATVDSGPDVGSGASTDGRHPGPSPAVRDGKEKTITARKKRRQSTHVRSQQPFWAALASTKVSVLKEMEQTQAALDAQEADARDANHVGNANFIADEDRIWIKEVGATEILFGACLMRRDSDDGCEERNGSCQSSRIDKSKPFYVRINGADWSSTTITAIRSPKIANDELPDRELWNGKIFGLSALSNYHCEFVQVMNQELIYTTSLITQQAPCDEQAVSVPPQSTLRPASPITTLKNTAVQNEKTLNEARNRLKKLRRDHKATLTTTKKEVDVLSSRQSSSSGTDDRQRQRLLQLNQSIRLNDEAAASFSEQAEELGEIPQDEQSEHQAVRTKWQIETDRLNDARLEFNSAKSEAEREVNHLKSEITSALQKRERFNARKAKLDEQYHRHIATNAKDEDAKQQHARHRAMVAAERANTEQEYRGHIQNFRNETANLSYKANQARAAIEHIEALYLAQAQQHQQQFSMPTTPEGPLPGTNGGRNMMHSPGITNFQFPPMTNTFGDSHASTPNSHRDGRGRSSSMLSGVSNFTDDMAFANGDGRDDTGSTGRSNSSGSPGPISPPTKKPSPVGSFR